MKIPIQNLYYLLCYAWDCLAEADMVAISRQRCPTPLDLLAHVLESCTTHLLKRGLDRNYQTESIDTSNLRGKLVLSETIKRNLLLRSQGHCLVDSLQADILHNQIIRSTIDRLIRSDLVTRELRDRLIRLHRRLHEITVIEVQASHFSAVRLHRNNGAYRFPLHVCELLHANLIADPQTGKTLFRDFLRDERQMARLFEKFIRNFFAREQDGFQVKSERLRWQEVVCDASDLSFLPTMLTDISLISPNRKIVIDAKYYTTALTSHHGGASIRSNNLYQLFAYLKNLERMETVPLEGMLIYPMVERKLDLRYEIQGLPIRIATLDLNQDWTNIHAALLGLIERVRASVD